MKAYYPINLPEWLGSETCCVISEKGSTEFSIPCMTGHTRLQKAGGMQKCTLPNIEITRRHPVILLRKWGKENGGHIMIQNINMAAILLYKTTNGWKKPINNPLLTLAILVYPPPKKNSEEISPQVREPGIFLLWSWILGLGIWITVQGLRNRTSDRNLESKS